MLEIFLEYLSNLILSNLHLAPFLALLAGIITSLLPCSLSTLPLIMTYVGVNANDTKTSIKLSLVFTLASAISYMLLAIIAVAFGTLIGQSSFVFNLFVVVLLLMMSLQMLGLYEFVKPTYLSAKSKLKGYLGAFTTGFLSGFFSSPCSTPVLIIILSLVSRGTNYVLAIVTLLFYSIGHSFLVFIVGSGSSFYKNYLRTNKMAKTMNIVNKIFAVIIMLFAFYLAYLNF